ncbi:DUF1059 domain-containing protein [Kineococcus terrestris]|uniref:DUF1059 domain-containing protein n=1 Tax=Kineococcus terrestris TaxID=2044856 RepID=UPI0034DB5A57
MKAFRCGDVLPGCHEEFVGADRDSVVAQVARHAREVHGLDAVPPAVLAQVDAQLRDVGPPPRA